MKLAWNSVERWKQMETTRSLKRFEAKMWRNRLFWRRPRDCSRTLLMHYSSDRGAGAEFRSDRSRGGSKMYDSYDCMTLYDVEFPLHFRNPKAALRVAKEARTMAQKNGDKRAEAMQGIPETSQKMPPWCYADVCRSMQYTCFLRNWLKTCED